jgi:methionyl-tRNA synthetase
VAYVCGSDEHGVAITIKAKNEGVSPQEVVDRYHQIMKQSFETFGISFDHYSRTSAPIHHETASELFTDLYQNGEFMEQETDQYYDEEAGQFLRTGTSRERAQNVVMKVPMVTNVKNAVHH